MNELIIIGILLLGGIAMSKAKGASGMQDNLVSIARIYTRYLKPIGIH